MNELAGAAADSLGDELLGDFLDESDQLLGRLNGNLLALDEWVKSLGPGEQARCDDDLMNEMFRAAHSFKGLSAMLGLNDINALTHKVENVFDAARKGQFYFSPQSIDVIFQSVDRLTAMVEALRNPGSDPVDAQAVMANIQQLLASSGVEREATSQADAERALAAIEEGLAEVLASDTPDSARTVIEAVEIDYFSGVADDHDISAKYLAIFIDEAELTLDSLTETLLAIEGRSTTDDTETLLITSHRIKGSAATVGLNRAAKLAHGMEDLVERLRTSDGQVTPEIADVLLACTDSLRRHVRDLRAGTQSSTDHFNDLWRRLTQCHEAPRGKAALPPPVHAAVVTPLNVAPPSLVAAITAQAPLGVAGYVVRVQFAPQLALVGLKARLIFEKASRLGSVFACVPAAETFDDIEELSELTLGVTTDAKESETIRQLTVAGVASVALQVLGVPVDASSAKSSETRKPTDSAPGVATTAVAATVKTPTKSAAAPAAPAATSKTPTPRPAAAAAAESAAAKPTETLRVDIERLDQLMNLAGQLVISKSRFAKIGDGLKQLTLNKSAVGACGSLAASLQRIAQTSRLDSAGADPHATLDMVAAAAERMQVDLDNLRNSLKQLTTLQASVNTLGEAIHQLDRVTDEIQKTVMDTRMVPIGPLFGRFRRVIRDITRVNGKDVTLVIRGEKTELDKRMIDELGDPLIHMVRNSVDHGIEPPEVREAAGKPRQGTVTLDAFHRGNSIVIQVSDDGKGLDCERIRAKAVEKGLLSAADAERLTPQQAFQLIWEPGFSTAEKVTEVSGRGMGMDIVKSKIEDLNGTVELNSEPGRGTVFTIKLPLTLAILPSLMAEIDGEVFALPIESVAEIVQVTPRDLATIHGVPTARVRGRVVSIVALKDVFAWALPPSRPAAASDDRTLVIIRNDKQEMGLSVDRLLGEEDVVIKSMAENYQNISGLAGASILGDGRVALILDTAALVEMSARTVARVGS